MTGCTFSHMLIISCLFYLLAVIEVLIVSISFLSIVKLRKFAMSKHLISY